MNLVFVYNANSGFTSRLIDSLHKSISPNTYSCDLCSLTHSNFGMKKEWRKFLNELPVEKIFIHKNEIGIKFPSSANIQLPSICVEENNVLKEIVSADILKVTSSLQIQKIIKDYFIVSFRICIQNH